jgi:hypothetical protein
MTDRDSSDHVSSDGEDADEAGVRALLRGALKKEDRAPDVLAGVQKKLRERSGGKFYEDAWSTAKAPPTLTFLATSALMLVIVALAYAVLAPLRGKAASVKNEPAAVEVIMPAPR